MSSTTEKKAGVISGAWLVVVTFFGSVTGFVAKAIGHQTQEQDENSPTTVDLKGNKKAENGGQSIKRTFT